MEVRELMRAGVRIKVTRVDKHFVMDMQGPALDIRGKLKDGEKLFFMAVVTPGLWPRLRESIAMAEKMMDSVGWLEGDPSPSPGPERILKLVKSE